MQTKKRAKPVKFGKPKEEKITKAEAESDINSDAAKEIKQLIEEKTHLKEELGLLDEKEEQEGEEKVIEKESEDEAELEVHLSDEPKDKEEKDFEDEEKEDEEKEDEQDEDKDEEQESSSASSDAKAMDDKEATEDKEEIEEEDKEESEESEDKKEEESENLDKESAEEEFAKEEKAAKYGSFTREEVLAPKKKSPWGFFVLVALGAFIVGLAIIAGGSYFLSGFDTNKIADIKLPALSQATPTPTTAPSATPTPEEVDLSAYEIRVLNGSGISGEAATLRTQLEDAEFVVDSVGNADTSDYTKTEVFAKGEVSEAYLNALIKELQTTYEVNSVTETLDDSESVDVEIIIGSDKAE